MAVVFRASTFTRLVHLEYESVEAVAQFVAKHGKRKLICMAGVQNDQQTARQVGALRAGMERQGLSLPDGQVVTVRIESAVQVYTLDLNQSVIKFFMQHPDFDAVFSLHPDQLAVLQHLHETGFRRCPKDFVHIHYGYYNNFYGGRPCPAFPSAFLSLPSVEVGRQAVIELEKMLGIESDAQPPDCRPKVVHDPY